MTHLKINRRMYIVAGICAMIFLIYGLSLFKIQIIDSDKYSVLSDAIYSRSQVIKASRGEIVDRNGVVIASNKNGFDIVLNKALIDPSSEDKTILDALSLLKASSIEPIDELPIVVKNDKIYLDKHKKKEIEKLKKFLNIKGKVDIDKIWSDLIKKYKLKDYDLNQARKILGIKYSMDQQGYSLTIPYILARNISINNLIKVKELGYRLPGVEILETPSREYLLNDLAVHIIGNVGPIYAEEYEKLRSENYRYNDTIGKIGIEKSCEKYLRGKDGERIISLNNDGSVNKIYDKIEPIPGNTVELTIDSNLQYVAQNALENQIKNLNSFARAGEGKEADSGAVVALDVRTGEILAMASYPSYNIDEYNKNFSLLINDEKKPLFNRALLGMYAPGSCYKPAVSVAALQEGICSSDSTVFCGHVYNFFSGYRPKCLGSHGNINVKNALKYSCNIFFYEVGRLLGIDRINDYSCQLGFGSNTGVQLYENIGQLASPELRVSQGGKWYPGDVLQAAIGQSDNLVTPLQLASYISTIANRGKRMNISVIKRVRTYNGEEVIYQNEPKVACKVKAREDVFETVIEGMTMASRSGTARRYFGNYPVTVPSKTGTPQTADLCNSTFICFAPDKDPEIAIAVVIEKGWHGYTGAPVAKEILDKYFGFK